MPTTNFIIMGDMIDSSKMPQPITQNRFISLIKEMNSIFKKDILSPLTITLGDEFQGVVNSSKTAIKLLIELEERLLFMDIENPIRLRYVVYEGEIDTDINRKNAHGMVGDGLKNARQLLNISKKGKLGNYVFIINNIKNFDFYKRCLVIFSMFIKEWQTTKDVSLIEWLLKEKDYKKAAAFYKKTISAMWKRRKSLNIDAYIALKELILSYE